MSDPSILFTPVRVGALTLDNRIVMAPMTRNRAGAGNVPTESTATYYAQRASAGLIVTEATQVCETGVGYPGTPGIHTAEQVDGWRRVTEAVHARDGKIFLQLWHVGRISHPTLQPDGALPVAPSAVRPEGKAMTLEGPKPFETPRALETHEIAGVVERYAHGTTLAKEAGFDGVEIHGANGYLIDQFLQENSNLRTDEYGGSIENRARFLVDVTRAVVAAWRADRVGIRLSPRGTFNDMGDSDRPGVFTHAVSRLDEFGLAYLHLVDAVPGHMMDNPAVPRFTTELRERFRGPIIINGGYTARTGAEMVASGTADLVAFGVPFLANPDLPARIRRGAELNKPDQSTFYGGDDRGYTDYPTLDDSAATVGQSRDR